VSAAVAQEGGIVTFGGRDRPLLAGPAEVQAEPVEREPVDLLARALADIADQHRVGLRIDPEAPWVAQAVGDDLRPRAGGRRERVPGRDRVRIAVARIDAKDAAEQVVERLAVGPDADRRRIRAAVADGDVEIAVGAELHHPAVVVGGRLDDPQELATGRVGAVGVDHRAVVLDDADVAVRVVVVRVPLVT
jgi:hypothetical protein